MRISPYKKSTNLTKCEILTNPKDYEELLIFELIKYLN